jgi:hypothetical protein
MCKSHNRKKKDAKRGKEAYKWSTSSTLALAIKLTYYYYFSDFYLLSLTIHEATKTVSVNTKDLTLKTTAIEIEGKTYVFAIAIVISYISIVVSSKQLLILLPCSIL